MVKEINATEFEELLSSGETFVCDFWAAWCMPCRMLAPVLDEASAHYENAKFVKVNVDECGEIAARYGVMSIPFVAVFACGQMKEKSIGYLPEEELREFLNGAL